MLASGTEHVCSKILGKNSWKDSWIAKILVPLYSQLFVNCVSTTYFRVSRTCWTPAVGPCVDGMKLMVQYYNYDRWIYSTAPHRKSAILSRPVSPSAVSCQYLWRVGASCNNFCQQDCSGRHLLEQFLCVIDCLLITKSTEGF